MNSCFFKGTFKRDIVTAKYRNFCFIISAWCCCQMPTNTQINLIKRFHTEQDKTGISRQNYRTARIEVDYNSSRAHSFVAYAYSRRICPLEFCIVFELKSNKNFQRVNATAIHVCCKWMSPKLIFGQDVQKSKLPSWWSIEPFSNCFLRLSCYLFAFISTFLHFAFFSCYKTIKRNYSQLWAILYKIWYIRRDSVPLRLVNCLFSKIPPY